MPEQAPAPDAAPLSLVLVDQSRDAMDAARDAADKRLTNELNEGSGLRRFVKGIWKGNIARDYYRQKYIGQEVKTLEAHQDVLYGTGDDTVRAEAKANTIDRFQGAYDDLIHTDAGERREVHDAESELAQQLKEKIREFCTSNNGFDEAALNEEKGRILQAYYEAHPEAAMGVGKVLADNMVEIAQAVAGRIEHGESLDNVLANMRVITGEARDSVRTEARYNRVDKVIAKVNSSKIGSWLQPETVAAGVSIAVVVGRFASHSALSTVTKAVAPGVAAGLWAGLRENRRVKDERAQHSRERAMGAEIDDHSKRREEMEKTRYTTESAVVMEQGLRSLADEEILNNGGNEAYKAAVAALIAAEARVKLSDTKNLDLISYTDPTMVGRERTDLDIARAEVRQALEGRLTDELRGELRLSANKSLKDYIRDSVTVTLDNTESDINVDIAHADKEFRSLRTKRVARAAITGAAVGMAAGLLAQEAVAGIGDVLGDPTRAGLIAQFTGMHIKPIDGQYHETTLESWFNNGEHFQHHGPSHEFTSQHFGSTGKIEVTNDHHIVDNKDGTISLIDPNGHTSVSHLKVGADGSLSPDALKELHHAGMHVEDHSFNQEVTTQQQVSVNQYVQNHLSEATHVTRDFWYANNTPNVYDHNELKLWWGGNAGLEQNGYAMNVSHMTADGSFEGSHSVDWQQAAAAGNLKLAVSASQGTQSEVFMVNINPDGSINIPADSPAGQFFENVDGHAQFNGAYAEVVQVTGVDQSGVTHMDPLATLVGTENQTSVVDTVTTTVHHAQYDIVTNGYETKLTNVVDMPPVVPIVSRRPLERTKRPSPERGYGYTGLEQDKWRRQRMPELVANPNAHIQPERALDFYYDQQRQGAGEAYVREIEERIDDTPELDGVDSRVRAMVVIPVAAAKEADNIYRALSLYSTQDDGAKQQTVITLNLNWTQEAENDPVQRAAIDKTLAEVERARQDFPDLRIAAFTKMYETRPKYGEIIKNLYDTAAFAVRRAEKRGLIAPDQDVLLITNDADPLGMHRHYLQHYVEAEEKYQQSDAFIGTIRWDSNAARQYPGYHTSQLFMQAMNIATTRTTGHGLRPATIGPNAAFRVSMYAAVGGCDGETGVGADSDLGRKVLAARKVTTSGGGYQPHSTNGNGAYGRAVIRQVVGADIDSDGSRLLNDGYRSGRFIPKAWDHFDDGKTRDEVSGSILIGPEDPRTDFPVIRYRVEEQINGFINSWYLDLDPSTRDQSRGALIFTISLLFGGGDGWRLQRTAEGYRFRFTQSGAVRFKNMLLRDTKGHFDPIANRLRRRLYGVVGSNAAKRPIAAEAPLVRSPADTV